MNFEDVGRVWREQDSGDFQRRKVENLSTARRRADRVLASFYRSGARFALLNLLVNVPLFGWALWNAPRPWLAAPGVAIVWTWLVIAWVQARSLGSRNSKSPSPVRIAVESEIARLRRIERLWARVEWWIMPCLIGAILAFEGFTPAGAARDVTTVLFYTLVVLTAVIGIPLRRRDARTKVRPLREELESWQAGLEAFDNDGRGR